MSYIDSINNKEQFHYKNVVHQGTDSDDGVVINQMESGAQNVLIRWVSTLYDLNLQYLTHDQVVEITKEVRTSVIEDGNITLDFTKMKTAGYFDMEGSGADPTFIIDPRTIKPSRISGTKYFNLYMRLSERQEV